MNYLSKNLLGTILLCLLVIVCVYADDFEQFSKTHGKVFSSSAEKTNRMAVFAQKMKEISALNAAAKKNNESVKFGVNKFSDLETHEFINKFTGFKKNAKRNMSGVKANSDSMLTHLKAAVTDFDWTKKTGIVSPVKDQGDCGSCWAFGAVAALESFNALKTGKSVTPLSEQQVNSCNSPPNGGCDGGDHYEALKYLQKQGSSKASVYPYTADDSSCRSKTLFIKPKYFKYINQATSETQMMSALQTYGPMAVALDATVLQSYTSGIISSCNRDINHVVTLVGFGTDAATKKKFWRLKNQWGSDWGEKGYFRLLRDKNMCGIAQEVYFLS